MSYKAEKLRKTIGHSNMPIVLDVRSKREYRQGHIPEAFHLPFWLVPFRYKSLVQFRDRAVVVYCENGPRAVFARQSLLSKGFCNVECLEGHMTSWRRNRFPLQKS